MGKEVAEVFNGFEKRMKFINIVRMITEYRYPDAISKMFGKSTDKDKLTNIVLAVMVFIKERTLGEDLDCKIDDIEHFLEDISGLFPEINYDSKVLAKYIIVDVLQHGGEIASFQTWNDSKQSFEMMPIRLVDEEHGKYTLTDDAFDFLFRIKDIDSSLDYSVTRFKMQEYMKRDNYSEALEQSRELVSRIRSIKSSMNAFLLLCRENISKVSIDDYEELIRRIRNLLDDEYQELLEIQKNAEERAEKLSDAAMVGVSYEDARKHRKALEEIIHNIGLTIDEQRSLINKKTVLSKQYAEILKDSYRVSSFERLNFEEDIMMKLRKMSDIGDAAKFLLFPLTAPDLEHLFSVESFYASQKNYDETEDNRLIDINNTEENHEIELIEQRNERHINILSSLFEYMKGKKIFTTEDYIDSLTLAELGKFCEENALPQILLFLYEIGEINIEEWKQDKNFYIKPAGEFELNWCLKQLAEDYLDMRCIRFSKTDQNMKFESSIADKKIKFNMTVLEVEVER